MRQPGRARSWPSPTTPRCAWKGRASCLDVVVDGQRNEHAARYHPETKPRAFAKGVSVEA